MIKYTRYDQPHQQVLKDIRKNVRIVQTRTYSNKLKDGRHRVKFWAVSEVNRVCGEIYTYLECNKLLDKVSIAKTPCISNPRIFSITLYFNLA